MALIARSTTWSSGDELTAAALNGEFNVIIGVLDDTTEKNVKITYNSSDLPNFHGSSTAANQEVFLATASGAGAKGFVVNDGSADVAYINRDGLVYAGRFQSTQTTGTAPFTVASTTVVTNLNADQVDGIEGTAFARTDQATETFDSGGTDTTVVIAGSTNGEVEVQSGTGAAERGRLRADGTEVVLQAYNGSSWDDYLALIDGSDLLDIRKPVRVDQARGTVQTLSDGANISWDVSAGQYATVTLAGNRTLDNPTNIAAGETYLLKITQDATGSRTLAYGTAYDFPGGIAPTLSTGASEYDVLSCVSFDGTSLQCTLLKDFS